MPDSGPLEHPAHNPSCHRLAAIAVMGEVELVPWLYRSNLSPDARRAILDMIWDRVRNIPDAA
jgi:hypothetical protein